MPTEKLIKDVDLDNKDLPGDNTEQRTLQWAQNLVERAKQARAQTFERMDDNLDYYENNGTWKNKSMPTYRAKVKDNRCFSNVESVLPIITDNRPKAEFSGNHPADKAVVDMLKEVYDAKYDDLDLELKTCLVVQKALVLSEGYWKIWFNPLLMGGMGDLDVQLVSPKLIFPDPDCCDPLMKDARYVAYHAPVLLSDIVARYPKKANELRGKYLAKYTNGNDTNETPGEGGYSTRGLTAIDTGDSQQGTTWVRTSALLGTEKTTLTELWVDDKTLVEETPDYIVYFDEMEAVERTDATWNEAIASGRDFDIYGAKDLSTIGLEDGTRYMRKYPNGRIIVYCEDTLLRDEPSPYEHSRCPYVRFFRYPVPDKNYFYGEIDMIKPLQDELNKRKSQIVDILQLTSNPPIIVNVLSGLNTDKMTNRPGGIWPVNTNVDQAVKWLQTPNIPSALFVQTQQINDDIDTVSGIHDVTQGRNPTGITAARAIDALQEATQTRPRLAARYLEYSLRHAAELMISIIWQYYREPRWIKKQTAGGVDYTEVNFYNTELKGGIPSVKIRTGSTLPVSKAVRQQQALDLYTTQAIDRRSLLEIFDWPDREEVLKRLGEGGPMQPQGRGTQNA